MSKIEQLRAEYESAMHAVQSGVAMDHARGSNDGSPKHLRVGINSAMVSDSAIVQLLIDKGLFTLEEFLQALVNEAVREKEKYEELLGPGVKLV